MQFKLNCRFDASVVELLQIFQNFFSVLKVEKLKLLLFVFTFYFIYYIIIVKCWKVYLIISDKWIPIHQEFSIKWPDAWHVLGTIFFNRFLSYYIIACLLLFFCFFSSSFTFFFFSLILCLCPSLFSLNMYAFLTTIFHLVGMESERKNMS